MSTYGPTAIAASSDDAREDNSGNPTLTDVTLQCRHSTNFWVGFRWPGTGIGQGATINTAKISPNFAVSSAAGDTVEVYGEKVAASGTFTTGASNLSGRTRTTAHTTFNMPTTTGVHDSPDLTTVIQEIVNVASFGGNITLLIDTTNCTASHTIYAFDNGSNICTLTITYTAASNPPISNGLCGVRAGAQGCSLSSAVGTILFAPQRSILDSCLW